MPEVDHRDCNKRYKLHVKNRVFLPLAATNPHSPETKNHHRPLGQRVDKIRPETVTRTWQPAERCDIFSKAIADRSPRILTDIFPRLLLVPFIYLRLIAIVFQFAS